ncbi:MAG: MFS transporter [Lawsonibacter sp.]|nr:MFS transporter [Lawsonibacter sp.]
MKNPPHRAWLVCLGGALAMFAVMGLGVNVFSIYQPEIIRLNGFTDAQGSWITTTRSLFILATLLCVNQLCARFGLRRVMSAGVLLVGLSCLCFAFADRFLLYCAAAALTGVGYCLAGMVPISLAVGRWFQDRQGLALGLASAGSGVSTVFAPVLLTGVVKEQGITAAFLWEGAVMFLCALLVWLLVQDAPGAAGPYRRPSSVPGPDTRRRGAGLSRLQWTLLLLAALFVGATGGPGFSHLTMLYTSSGYSSLFVAGLLSYLGAMISLGKIVCGQVYDRLGGLGGNRFAFGTLLLALALCTLAPIGGVLLPVLAITAFGLGLSITAVSPARWAGDLCADYESGVRSITLAFTAGMLVFGPLPGLLADWLGGYVPAYAAFFALLLAAYLIVQGLYRRRT